MDLKVFKNFLFLTGILRMDMTPSQKFSALQFPKELESTHGNK